MLQGYRPRRIRTLREFMESEIRIPDGPDKGLRFTCVRQPYTALWFDAHAQAMAGESGLNTFIGVGPTQSGKTLSMFIGPAMFHLFEIRESIACLVPDENMVNDKWQEDFLPAIRASRFADQLPTSGQGARGGRVSDAVRFKNGTTLKFLTAGGDDKSVAGFTTRVLFVTELNKFNQRSTTSSEGNRFAQAAGRLRAYGDRAMIYAECTVDTEAGLVWTEYRNGTSSRIAMPCGYCGDYVTLGRENLTGWEDAKNAVEATRLAHWNCPACGTVWDKGDREKFAQGSVLIHNGQEVRRVAEAGPVPLTPGALLPGYELTGEQPETFTLGFRWSAVDNMFTDAGRVGMEEWKRVHATADEESAERELRQFVWALPIEDTTQSTLSISAQAVRRRQGRDERGVIPEGWDIAAFMDLGQRLCHWAVVAGRERYQVVDVGYIEVPSGDMPVEQALGIAMWQFYDRCGQGWGGRQPGTMFIDSGKWTTAVYDFVRQASAQGARGLFATKGHGMSQDQSRVYAMPDALSAKLPYIGDRYHIRLQEAHGIYLVHMDSDAWKSRVHSALAAPLGEEGSLVLWKDDPRAADLWSLSKHLTAEVGVTEFDPKRGNVQRWERKNANNHFLDCVYGALVGLDYQQVVAEAAQRPAAAASSGQGKPGVFRWTRE